MASRRHHIESILHNLQLIRRSLMTRAAEEGTQENLAAPWRRNPSGSRWITFDTLSPAQIRVFMSVISYHTALGRGPGVKALAESMLMSSSAITQAVDKLVEEGFVQRIQDPEDRRATIIELSARTRERMEQLKNYFQSQYSPLFDVLSTQELAEYDRLNEKLAKAALSPYFSKTGTS